MNQNKKQVYPLFSTPLYVNNVGQLDLPDIKSLEYSSMAPTGGQTTFLSTVDKHVLERPEFEKIRGVITGEIDFYAREVFCVNRDIEFYITNSWVNINRPGDQGGIHNHNNSLISGVLYLKTNDSSGDIIFYRDVMSLLPFPPSLDLGMGPTNIYNCKHFGHRPKTGDICLFPSFVMHSVGLNESDQERWCLPFNVYVRGNIGGLHELVLK